MPSRDVDRAGQRVIGVYEADECRRKVSLLLCGARLVDIRALALRYARVPMLCTCRPSLHANDWLILATICLLPVGKVDLGAESQAAPANLKYLLTGVEFLAFRRRHFEAKTMYMEIFRRSEIVT